MRILEWKPTGAQQALGEWEKYTTVSLYVSYLCSLGYRITSVHYE